MGIILFYDFYFMTFILWLPYWNEKKTNKTKKLCLFYTFLNVASVLTFLVRKGFKMTKMYKKIAKKEQKRQKSNMHIFMRFACTGSHAHAQILLINSGEYLTSFGCEIDVCYLSKNVTYTQTCAHTQTQLKFIFNVGKIQQGNKFGIVVLYVKLSEINSFKFWQCENNSLDGTNFLSYNVINDIKYILNLYCFYLYNTLLEIIFSS